MAQQRVTCPICKKSMLSTQYRTLGHSCYRNYLEQIKNQERANILRQQQIAQRKNSLKPKQYRR